MKKGIFNMYVKLICDGLDLSEDDLFSSSRNREIAHSRQLLYKLCYQRPMTINQIVSLMDGKGHSTTYENIRQGITSISKSMNGKSKDKDLNDFYNDCVKQAEECC
jgi:chromosomal replication initiation ATPase DnaA|tara:strand:- start:781 stop:1098 length:318 start_codon:yes stop_codon:yes gene_type:complete